MAQKFEHTVGTVTMQAMSNPGDPGYKNPGDVNFKVAYAKDFEGDKPLPVGQTLVVSKEVAEQFTALGFGSVVTEDAKQSVAEAPAAQAEGDAPAAGSAEATQPEAENTEAEPAAQAEGDAPAKKGGTKKANAK